MCSSTNQQIIDQVVSDFLDQKRAFTAFEVSIAARKLGADERHRHMKAYIHAKLADVLNFGNYCRTLIPVGDGHQAFLYHDDTYNPSDYVPLNTSQPKKLDTKVHSDSEGYSLDYRNRLLVPTQFFKQIGAEPHSTVQLKPTKGTLFIERQKDQGSSSHVIERDGNLRLSHKMLLEAQLQYGSFDIQANDEYIEIFNVDDQGNRIV